MQSLAAAPQSNTRAQLKLRSRLSCDTVCLVVAASLGHLSSFPMEDRSPLLKSHSASVAEFDSCRLSVPCLFLLLFSFGTCGQCMYSV